MTSAEAISKAEGILPGTAAPEGEDDARWQAIIAVAEFIQTEPESVWSFAARWGRHSDLNLRQAIATCVLEHLLEHHFSLIFPRMESLAHADQFFADTVAMCWRFGEATLPANASKLDRLVKTLKRAR